MATGLIPQFDRRRAKRLPPAHTPWQALALLRPGQDVTLVNIGCGGALLESASRMLPGARADLQLIGTPRCTVRGRIHRCQVTCLDPLRYRGAIVFDEPLDLALQPQG
jgi:hypothetical protein